jgi:cytochrome c oxidase subunit IV
MRQIGALFFLLLPLAYIVFMFGLAGLSIYGLVLAFQASILVGVIALVAEPLPLIIGLVQFFGHTNLAQKLAHLLGVG